MLTHDGVADLLPGAHGLADGSNVRVVPGVVVDKGRAVGHTTNLVSVVPPRHDLGVLRGVLPKPVVCLTVVIDDVLAAVRKSGGEHDGGRRVGVRSDPCAVQNEQHEVDGGGSGDGELGGIRVDADERVTCRSETLGKDSCSSDCSGIGAAVLGDGLGGLDVEVGVENLRESDCRCNADNGSQSEHETNHDTSEVTGEHSVDDNEDLLVGQSAEAQVDTSGEEPDHHVEIEEESGPCGRLVLGDRGDDRNVNLGVSGIPERVETASPGRNDTRDGQKHQSSDTDEEDAQNQSAEQRLELLSGKLCANPVDKGHQLEETKDTERGHVLATADGQETDEGNLHTRKRTERIPRSVADVQSRAVSSHADQDESVQGQQVGDEDVSTPR